MVILALEVVTTDELAESFVAKNNEPLPWPVPLFAKKIAPFL
jgi:hypothetical protein